jgi:myo-inositol-1(or 4)-monophosphatase
MNLIDQVDFVTRLAESAAQIVMDQYGKVRRLTKRQEEAVTDADRASQRHIVSELRGRFSGDGFVGEENETGDAITFECPNPAGRVWVIDPIDGTNNFIAGLGNFAVCIGLLQEGIPKLGVVRDVTRGLSYVAWQGGGAWQGTTRILAPTTPMGDSSLIMLTSNLVDSKGHAPAYLTRWITDNKWKIRILGSAALEAAMVAAGVAHGAITVNGKLWDIAAPAALVLESGALLTNLTGGPIFPYNLIGYTGAKVPFLAAGPAAQARLLEEINR